MLFYGGSPPLKLLDEMSMTLYNDHFTRVILQRILNLLPAFPLKSGAPFEHFFEYVPGRGVVCLFKSQSLFDEPCDDPAGYGGIGGVQEYDKVCMAEAGVDPIQMGAFDDPAFVVDDA